VAKAWRAAAQTAIRRGTMRGASQLTLREAAEAWHFRRARRKHSQPLDDRYEPSVVRGYETSLRLRVLPELGGRRLSEVRRSDLQDFADRLLAEATDASTIRNTLMPLRAIFRRAVARGDVAVNPTSGLELPAVRGRRDRVASPEEAKKLVEALPERDHALWANVLYGGLRRGECFVERDWIKVEATMASDEAHVLRQTPPKRLIDGPLSARIPAIGPSAESRPKGPTNSEPRSSASYLTDAPVGASGGWVAFDRGDVPGVLAHHPRIRSAGRPGDWAERHGPNLGSVRVLRNHPSDVLISRSDRMVDVVDDRNNRDDFPI